MVQVNTVNPLTFCYRCYYYKKRGSNYRCTRRTKNVLCGQIQHYVKTANNKVELIKDIY